MNGASFIYPVSFLFHNPGDVFHTESLMKLDIKQFLCLELHKQGYKAVYFLSENENGTIHVSDFGEKNAVYNTKGIIQKKEIRDFDKNALKSYLTKGSIWLEERNAVVCRLSLFLQCDTGEIFKSFPNREGTIILLVSPEEEDYLSDPGIRKYLNIVIPEEAPEKKLPILLRTSEKCVFLNRLTHSRVRNTLTRYYIEKWETPPTEEELNRMIDYVLICTDKIGRVNIPTESILSEISGEFRLKAYLDNRGPKLLMNEGIKTDVKLLNEITYPPDCHSRCSLPENSDTDLVEEIRKYSDNIKSLSPDNIIRLYIIKYMRLLDFKAKKGEWSTYKRLLYCIVYCLKLLGESGFEYYYRNIADILELYIFFSGELFKVKSVIQKTDPGNKLRNIMTAKAIALEKDIELCEQAILNIQGNASKIIDLSNELALSIKEAEAENQQPAAGQIQEEDPSPPVEMKKPDFDEEISNLGEEDIEIWRRYIDP